mgnify:CR=1 FL=1
MTENFKQIDSVFGEDVPMCGLNLKKLWCEYTCNPTKVDFVLGTGYNAKKMDDGTITNFTMVTFAVDESMSCTLFQSCKKVSLIAQASL